MAKFPLYTAVLLSVLFSPVWAVTSTTNAPSAQTQSAPTQLGDDIASSTDQLNSSYAGIAKLQLQTQIAEQQIAAEKMKQQLESIKATNNQVRLGFSLYQIIGFDNDIKAVLLMDSGSMSYVSPGGKVTDVYTVSLITPQRVMVTNVHTGHSYAVPFYYSSGGDSTVKGKSQVSGDEQGAQGGSVEPSADQPQQG